MKSIELRKLRAERIAAMEKLLEATGPSGIMNDKATEQFTALEAEQEKLKGAIALAERAEALGKELGEIPNPAPRPMPGAKSAEAQGDTGGFKSFGEFIYANYCNPQDPRLRDVPRAEQSMSTGSKGGLMVPTQFGNQLLEVRPGEIIFTPQRATEIPAGDPPDAALEMPSLDQSSAQNMFGGVAVSWIAEGGTKAETDANLKSVRLEPKELAAFVKVTDKLLRNWPAADAVLRRLFGSALAATRDKAFLSGNGVGKPLGILSSGALKTQNREINNQVSYLDLVGMEQKMIVGGNPCWIISRSALAQIRQLKDLAGRYILTGCDVGQAEAGIPMFLLGYPICWSVRSPALGTKGDVCLCDLSYYLIKNGSGPYVASSEHVYWTSNKTAIKAFLNVDGQPWLGAPIVNEDSQSYSPFVALDVPA